MKSSNTKDDIKNINFVIDYDKSINKLNYSKNFIDNLTVGSDFKLYFKCKLCGTTLNNPIRYRDLVKSNGHIRRCDFCSDKISIGEKFISNLLNELDINYIKELNKTTYEWCKNYRYDFYFKYDNEEYIIETHGEQHYRDIGRGRNLEEEQQNDLYKKELAIKNGIKEENYIVINCSKESEIKNNVLNSNLNKIVTTNNINWKDIYKKCFEPILFKVCDIWNKKGNSRENLLYICDKFKISEFKARELIKLGEKINICKYNHDELIRNRTIKIRNSNKVNLYKCCLNNEVKYFKSYSEICDFYNVSPSIIIYILKSKKPYKIHKINYYEKYKHVIGLYIEKIN